jgi:hypothetical protein
MALHLLLVSFLPSTPLLYYLREQWEQDQKKAKHEDKIGHQKNSLGIERDL